MTSDRRPVGIPGFTETVGAETTVPDEVPAEELVPVEDVCVEVPEAEGEGEAEEREEADVVDVPIVVPEEVEDVVVETEDAGEVDTEETDVTGLVETGETEETGATETVDTEETGETDTGVTDATVPTETLPELDDVTDTLSPNTRSSAGRPTSRRNRNPNASNPNDRTESAIFFICGFQCRPSLCHALYPFREKRTIPAATETLRDSFVPRMGIESTASLPARISRLTPSVSFPTNRARSLSGRYDR